MIFQDLLIKAVKNAVDLAPEPERETDLTADVGALVRDKGEHVALEAARLRRAVGFLADVGNCGEYVLPKHRRRLR